MTLNEKIRDVLLRLATLSEAPASRPSDMATAEDLPKDQRMGSDRFGKQPKKHHESVIPAGVRENVDPDRPPPKDRSLHDWYVWQFEHAADQPHRLLTLYLLAERDYMTRRFHVPNRMALRSGDLTDNDAIDGGVAERAAAERVVDLYEGVSAVEVAVHEYTTEIWVKKARRMHGRNPADGRPRAEFLDWDEDRRGREVAALAGRGLKQPTAARKLGIAKSTLQRYWPQERDALAA